MYDLLFHKYWHMPVVLKQILPSWALSCVTIFQQHLGFLLPLQSVLTPFPWPNLKVFTPSTPSQFSSLYQILHSTLFLKSIPSVLTLCMCLLTSLFAFSVAPLTYIPILYSPASSSSAENVEISELFRHGKIAWLAPEGSLGCCRDTICWLFFGALASCPYLPEENIKELMIQKGCPVAQETSWEGKS